MLLASPALIESLISKVFTDELNRLPGGVPFVKADGSSFDQDIPLFYRNRMSAAVLPTARSSTLLEFISYSHKIVT
jgi:hypothetical protein